VELGEAFTLLSVPHVNQVHLFYRARLLEEKFAAGEESLEVSLFSENEIPWDALAFRTVSLTLRHFFSDRKEARFRMHAGEILPQK
jgi:hypothetical protein